MALVLALMPLPAFGQRLDVEPVWNGFFRQGEATEVVVRFAGDAALDWEGPFELTLVDEMEPGVRYRNLNVLPNSPLRAPVTVVQSGRLNLALARQGELVIETTSRLREARGDNLVAIAASLALPPGIDAEVAYVAPEALPVFPGSYRVIDLLVLDSAALAALTPLQNNALEHHVRGCGRTLFLDVEAALVSAFMSLAGCSGRFLASTESESEIKGAVELLFSRDVRALPTSRQLQSLLGGDEKEPLYSIALLLALYLAVLSVLAARGHGALLIGTPVFFTAITFLAFYGSTRVNGHIASWGETESGSASIRYKSLLRIPGIRRGHTQFDVSTAEELPKPTRDGTRLGVEPQPGNITTHTVNISLLGAADLTLLGSLPSGPMLQLALRDGVPVVTNPAATVSNDVTLAYDDQKFVVPRLAPGDEWQPAAPLAEAWQQTPIDRLFRERALRSGPVLLVSTEDPFGFAALGAGDGYIMVRP